MTITKEGSLTSFYTVNKAPIKHLKVYFSPKQAGEGDPSPENVREISGWNSLTISHTPNTNLFYQDTLLQAQGWVKSPASMPSFNGVPVYYGTIANLCGSGKPFQTKLPVDFQYEPNTQYRVTYWWRRATPSTANGMKVYFDYTDGTSTNTPNNSNNTENFVRVATTSTSGKTIAKIHLNYNSSSSIYIAGFAIEKIDGRQSGTTDVLQSTTIYPISLSSVGTIYGGYVDLITGELIQTHKYILLNESDAWTSGNRAFFYKNELNFFSDREIDSSNTGLPGTGNTYGLICSIALANTTENFYCRWTSITEYNFALRYSSNLENPPTLEQIKALASEDKISVVYKLATPITYQLTPLELETFLGRNNIWSNADRVEVEYDLAESNEELYKRRHLLLQGSPHIENATGAIANFNTDIVAPLKECKVHFAPIQAGSGDPSSNNVREIIGRDKIDLYYNSSDMIPITPNGEVNTSSNDITLSYNNNTHSYICTGLATKTTTFKIPINTFTLRQSTTNTIQIYTDAASQLIVDQQNNMSCAIGFISNNSVVLTMRTIISASQPLAVTTIQGSSFNKEYEITELAIGILQGSGNCRINVNIIYGTYYGTTLNWSNDIGTIYGGYVDLIRGQIYSDYYQLPINSLTSENVHKVSRFTDYDAYYFDMINLDVIPESNADIPNMFFENYKVVSWDERLNNTRAGIASATTTNNGGIRIQIFTEKDAYETIENFNASFTNRIILLKRQTPIIYQLTPTQLKTLKGTNNIWSNANGPVSISYWTH